jgi:hypothetical protein
MCIFDDKLLNLRPSDISNLSVRHVRGIRFGCIRRDLKYAFTLRSIPRPPPPVGGDLGDSVEISSLLLPICKVLEENSSHHRIGPLPNEFIPSLLSHGNSLGFNLLLSFPSFFLYCKSIPLVNILIRCYKTSFCKMSELSVHLREIYILGLHLNFFKSQ